MKSNSAETYSSFTLRRPRPWSERQHTTGEGEEIRLVCTDWDFNEGEQCFITIHCFVKDVGE